MDNYNNPKLIFKAILIILINFIILSLQEFILLKIQIILLRVRNLEKI